MQNQKNKSMSIILWICLNELWIKLSKLNLIIINEMINIPKMEV